MQEVPSWRPELNSTADMTFLLGRTLNNLTKAALLKNNQHAIFKTNNAAASNDLLRATSILRNKSTNSDNDQKSAGPVRSLSSTCNQNTNPQKLPHFPVQPLRETLVKFMTTCEPLLTEEEYKETCKQADQFLDNEGAKLQQLLEEQAKKQENWLAPRWLKAAYLQYRDPVCVFSSPGMTFPYKMFNSDEEYLNYTAKIIYVCLKYKNMIDTNKIPVEKMGKRELDMSQYRKVFGTCRIPGLKEDSLVYNPDSKHIAISYMNNWYNVSVYSKDGSVAHPDEIYKKLVSIYCHDAPENEKPIGILTAAHRDLWGAAYQELIKDPANASYLSNIQNSLFTVSLDKEVPLGQDNKIATSEQLIHGGGSSQNAGNRWFDKTIQLVVNRNGINGFTYEHSPAEGQPIANMTEFIHKALSDEKLFEAPKTNEELDCCRMDFKLTPKIEKYIEEAKASVDKLAKDLDMHILHYKTYGKEFVKAQKLSPDSFCQMAMQYAFYKLHNVPAAQYESAHLRLYPGGRTETIRSCSNESVTFAKSMLEKKCTSEERMERLRKAVNAHREYTIMALEGKGVDRHLLGLKLMAIENGLPIPEFFKSPGVVKSSTFRMSTSQVASNFEVFMCYGPLTNDGYGCCYNPRKNDMLFSISSWKTNDITNSKKFSVALTESLDEMLNVMCDVGENAKSKL